jgi:hypothetical protein
MGNDQILLNVHHVVDGDASQLGELGSALLKELGDRVALLALLVERTSSTPATTGKRKSRDEQERTVTTFLCPLPSQYE